MSGSGFAGLAYFDYDPARRVTAERASGGARDPARSTSAPANRSRSRESARARSSCDDAEHTLDLYWLEGYGGGLFLPFRDGTSGRETYGAGRYLLDTVKGADLGTDDRGRLVLDFNFAYNPSCAYDPVWSCPLAPPGNRLPRRRPGGGADPVAMRPASPGR